VFGTSLSLLSLSLSSTIVKKKKEKEKKNASQLTDATMQGIADDIDFPTNPHFEIRCDKQK